ncbi:MAG: inorganic phosphate transporter [Deltaproteobacteria bacterium]|nr:inorganic phosphate transporter [Deltaproteobacteria bacterium]
MELYLFSVILLMALAVLDLIVGVSNDAVNFLNSSFGSKVASRTVIMIIASLGILVGVTFSSGMMEVARKGIFHPEYFYMTDIMVIFLAVMLTDILLLDFFNTFGFPTSTTVSIVFELLGSAVAVSLIKIHQKGSGFSGLAHYINTDKALAIIMGILLSVVVAFFFGMMVQFISRLIFTFDFKKRLRRYGALWGGCALSIISYFILIKGAKGASFINPETARWIMDHAPIVMLWTFMGSAFFLQLLMIFTRINILKPIVLIGTFALAMSFAANDLVNFIGVPLAGMTAYGIAKTQASPLGTLMEALKEPIQTNTFLLLAAGAIMVATLWLSRKARSVTETEVRLGRQEEGIERFGSSHLSRIIVRMGSSLFEGIKRWIPRLWRRRISQRLDPNRYKAVGVELDGPPSFDLLRASVNLVVASALVSFATSLKLPLSTTYVTFMVAMGTSLSDQAWGRESAAYRVAGVLAVIGGWFFTAFCAFTVSLLYAFTIYFFKFPAILGLLGLSLFLIRQNYRVHHKRVQEADEIEVIDLKRLRDAEYGMRKSFEHSGFFLKQVNLSLAAAHEALYSQDRRKLKRTRKETKKIQNMANVIIANIFKTLRLLHSEDQVYTQTYYQTIRTIQEIAESQRDFIIRAFVHIDNHHKGLLKAQVSELREVFSKLTRILEHSSMILMKREPMDFDSISKEKQELEEMVKVFNKRQIVRIRAGASKTRLSILYYALLRDVQKIADATVNLLGVFQESFSFKQNL